MRAGLIALAEIKAEDLASGTGMRRPDPKTRQLRRFSPIFGVRDLAAALAHYASLGFRTSAYDDADYYGFADRDGTGLHLALRESDTHPAAAYLYVRDADALYEEWSLARYRRSHPSGRPDRLRTARGLAHRPGRQPHPVRLSAGGVTTADGPAMSCTAR